MKGILFWYLHKCTSFAKVAQIIDHSEMCTRIELDRTQMYFFNCFKFNWTHIKSIKAEPWTYSNLSKNPIEPTIQPKIGQVLAKILGKPNFETKAEVWTHELD